MPAMPAMPAMPGMHAMHMSHADAGGTSGEIGANASTDSSLVRPCIGLCCCAPTVGAPRIGPMVSLGLVGGRGSVAQLRAASILIRRTHALPFANGPPAAVRA
jgi:hypothetical protein